MGKAGRRHAAVGRKEGIGDFQSVYTHRLRVEIIQVFILEILMEEATDRLHAAQWAELPCIYFC
jgi:hypothetical protein